LDDPESAPHKALNWLAFEDQMQLPIPPLADHNAGDSSTVTTGRPFTNIINGANYGSFGAREDFHILVERYVVTVLYFATGERFDFRFESESVCAWNTDNGRGIHCRGSGIDVADGSNAAQGDSGVTHILLPRSLLVGYFPSEVCQLPKLMHIDFSQNSLGHLPDDIGKCSQLEYLHLWGNPWTVGAENKGFPNTLFDLTNLKSIQLHGSSLQDSLPSTIGKLSKLEVLQMSSNKIHGSIPPELWNTSTLQFLDLGHNNIEGKISPAISNTNLTHLVLATNILEGAIPTQIGALSNLVHLDLSSNYLSGIIPNELSSLSSLVGLDLSRNFGLSGSLDDLCDLTLSQEDTSASNKTSFFSSEQLDCSCCTIIED